MTVKPVARSNAMAIDNDVSMSVESLTMTEEEAETQAKALFGESTIDDLQAKVWKVRLAGIVLFDITKIIIIINLMMLLIFFLNYFN